MKRNLVMLFVVSTCNRTEIYTTSHNYIAIAEMYCKECRRKFDGFHAVCKCDEKRRRLYHLFRVSAGLESQILGDF